MIATLQGQVSEKITDVVVLDIQGVGYGLLTTAEDFGILQVGQSAKVYVYEHIREQAHDLFGFLTLETKKLFELLLGVNGVGPKMALNVLSIGRSEEVCQAIASGDTKYIQSAQGVGKRVAERIVLDLKGKIGMEANDNESTSVLFQSHQFNSVQDEAVTALIGLGYSTQDALAMLQRVDATLPLEQRITQALRRNS